MKTIAFKERAGCEGGGKGFLNGPNGKGDMEQVSPTNTKTDVHAVAYAFDSLASNSMKSPNPHSGCNMVDVSKALDTSRGLDPSCNQGGIAVAMPLLANDYKEPQAVSIAMQVRRLTPTECEALQGFPLGYTDIMPNGKPTPDGSRYKALGNSMAVNCMEWIGSRIQIVDDINET